MLAQHPARVLAVGARLRAKARRVRHKLLRQLARLENRVTHQIRDWNLGGGDEVQTALAARSANRSCSIFGSWPVPVSVCAVTR